MPALTVAVIIDVDHDGVHCGSKCHALHSPRDVRCTLFSARLERQQEVPEHGTIPIAGRPLRCDACHRAEARMKRDAPGEQVDYAKGTTGKHWRTTLEHERSATDAIR